MTIYNRMMKLLSVFRVYDENNTFLAGELYAYETGLNIAKKAGFKQYAIYEKHNPVFIDIP